MELQWVQSFTNFVATIAFEHVCCPCVANTIELKSSFFISPIRSFKDIKSRPSPNIELRWLDQFTQCIFILFPDSSTIHLLLVESGREFECDVKRESANNKIKHKGFPFIFFFCSKKSLYVEILNRILGWVYFSLCSIFCAYIGTVVLVTMTLT